MKTVLICLSLCISTCFLTACENEGRSRQTQRRLQVQDNGDSIEILGPDGRVLIKGNQQNASLIFDTDDTGKRTNNEGANKPESNLPDDIPILPGCTITMSQVFKNGQNAIATLTTDKDPQAVIQFYEGQIPIKGWEPGSRFDLDNIVMLNGKRGSASLNISITTENQTTTINMARTENTEQINTSQKNSALEPEMTN